MACGCGRRAALPRQGVTRGINPAQAPARRDVVIVPPRTVQIVYQGPIGSHLVPSPMRLVRTYGLHTRGDVFAVQAADQQAKPQIFVLVDEANG